jgi:hypothetical protein
MFDDQVELGAQLKWGTTNVKKHQCAYSSSDVMKLKWRHWLIGVIQDRLW